MCVVSFYALKPYALRSRAGSHARAGANPSPTGGFRTFEVSLSGFHGLSLVRITVGSWSADSIAHGTYLIPRLRQVLGYIVTFLSNSAGVGPQTGSGVLHQAHLAYETRCKVWRSAHRYIATACTCFTCSVCIYVCIHIRIRTI